MDQDERDKLDAGLIRDRQKIHNDTITIESVEQKNEKITLVAHNRNRYGFWTTKKDGTDSAPYSQFKNMGLKKGATVRIGYVIEQYTDKMGVVRESKKIINFQETNEAPSQIAPPAESSNGGANRGHSGESRDAFGRRLAVHGFVNGMLAAGATVETITKDLTALIRLEDAIDLVLNGAVSELPTIQVEDGGFETIAKDIPF